MSINLERQAHREETDSCESSLMEVSGVSFSVFSRAGSVSIHVDVPSAQYGAMVLGAQGELLNECTHTPETVPSDQERLSVKVHCPHPTPTSLHVPFTGVTNLSSQLWGEKPASTDHLLYQEQYHKLSHM